MMGRGSEDHHALRHRTPYLLGRLVFTLTRTTSQPSLLNMGVPVSSSFRSRLVAVMFRTTLISMFPPVKLEHQADRQALLVSLLQGLLCPLPLPTTSASKKGESHMVKKQDGAFPLPSYFYDL